MRSARIVGLFGWTLLVFGAGVAVAVLWIRPLLEGGRGDGAMPRPGAAPASDKPGRGKKVLYWKSPMVAGEIHRAPGKDSMGMDLVPVYEGDAAGPGRIEIDPTTQQNMGVRIAEVTQGPLSKSVRTVGIVDYDETTLATVTTKVGGWIEKLHVEETGAQVHAGEPLFEIYSPALYAAQEEYLAALRGVQTKKVAAVPYSLTDSRALVRDARTRLAYFDISDEQIEELERTRVVRKTMTVRSGFTGVVIHKGVVEGQRVAAGEKLFRIADLSRVWVLAKVYEYDLPYVYEGQEARMTLTYLPGKTFTGRVTYVYPFLEQKTREISVRMEFHNPGYDLKPGMYATVRLTHRIAATATLVPDMAVINTGERSVAFVAGAPGRFELRDLKVGVRGEGNVLQVLSGLAPGDKVVVSGQFLLDSESRLREAALKFLEPGKPKAGGKVAAKPGSSPAKTGGTGAGDHAKLHYACPMPEHSSVLYDRPGPCPICGKTMQLVPVRGEAHGAAKKLPVRYWTCPMPEHASVHEHGPGSCPICGMTLVPVRGPKKREGKR